MHRATLHLLRSSGRQAMTVVAIVALMLSVLRMPCLLDADQDHGVVASQALQPASDGCGDASGANDVDDCGFCHCSVTTTVIPEALARIAASSDGRGAQRPTSCRAPDGPVHAPDVPPDQA